MAKDSVGNTLLVAFAVALTCSLVVSAAVYYLRPMQLAYTKLLQNRIIIETAGLTLTDDRISDREVVNRFLSLDAQIVDLDTGEFMIDMDALSFDQRAAAQDVKLSVPISDSSDIAQLKRRSRYAPVYIVWDEGNIDRLVLPIHGQGMWSRIYGYISLADDLNTVVAIRFYEHGETPGIGDRIQNAEWTSLWSGKHLFDNENSFALQVSGNNGASPYRVDSISGATVTTEGVGKLVRYWLGDDGFGPFLTRLREIRNSNNPED